MNSRVHVEQLPKDEVVRLYQKEVMMFETNLPFAENFPNAKTINEWNVATLDEARRRLVEVMASPDSTLSVEMVYDRPRDIINFQNRLSGDPEI